MTTPAAPPTSRPRRRDARENRERILEAAVRVIATEGVNVPLATIAAAAETGVATFYRSFGDREALLVELGHRAFDLLNALVDEIEEAGLTGLPAIEQYLLGTLQIGDHLVLPLHGGPVLDDPVSDHGRRRLHTRLQRFVDAGRAQGAIAAPVEAVDVVICGALINQPVRRRPGWERWAVRHVGVFLAGLTSGRPLEAPTSPAWDVDQLLGRVRVHDGGPPPTAQTS